MSFLGKIGIDFKLLIAQIINFLVLLWLLKIFLYKPLLKNLKERAKYAKEIEEGKKEIKRREEEMIKKEKEIIQKAKEKAKEIIEEGKEISEEEKERILTRAEEEMKKILRAAREKAEIEVKKIKAKEKEEILKKSIEILQKILSDSLTLELHRKYIQEIIQNLKKINWEKIKEKEFAQVTIISAIPLTSKEKKEISNILFQKLENSAFEEKIDPKLIAGIEIQINGFVIEDNLKEKIEKEISNEITIS